MHPNYVSRQVADDIALINLNEPVVWSDHVQPACLPNPDKETFSGILATVAGWGWTDEIKNGISFDIDVSVGCAPHSAHCYSSRDAWNKIDDYTKVDSVILGGKRAETLQKVDVPIMENKECQQWFVDAGKKLVVVDTCMCAGLENGGKDSCQVSTNSQST